MGSKLISLVLVLYLIFLPVQVFSCGGGGNDRDIDVWNSAGGPPLTFTPPRDSDYGLPDSYTNPGVADSTTTFTDEEVMRAIQEREMISGFLHRTNGHIYDGLVSVGEDVKIAGKVAIKGLAVLGATAGVIALSPFAAAGAAGTVSALGFTAAALGGAALAGGALMEGAETYGKDIDEGKSQNDAAGHGMTSGLAKGAIDEIVDAIPGLGTIDLLEKARTGGKGIADQLYEGVYKGDHKGAIGVPSTTPMTPIPG